MRTICESVLCTGCAACSQVCPQGAIAMTANSEGFLYPRINEDICSDCGLCIRTCPVNKALETGSEGDTVTGAGAGHKQDAGSRFYACCSVDEAIRTASSSGGVFSHLAKSVLSEGGVVFGAGFDEKFKVRHACIEDVKKLDSLRRSKYVQSEIGDSFRQARGFLDEGRKVLFCGTPCQIAGLRAFLGREYGGLLACDLACHGVPSPKVWDMYLEYLRDKYKSEIKAVSFRDKSTGWNNSSMRIDFKNGSKYMDSVKREIFFIGFGKSIFNRRSCFNCLFRINNTKADITLADFWGIDKISPGEFTDNRGVSLVITHTPAGEEAFLRIKDDVRAEEKAYNAAVKYNPRLVSSVPEPPARKSFFGDLVSGYDFDRLVEKYMDNKSLKYRVKCIIKRILGRG
ncbi:MAG: Coenzyme F420 hydrogenase/dehydrogenase, beta subunit C-terminal domain [Acetivibrionales bacterium]